MRVALHGTPCYVDVMATIPITRGYEAIVDDEDVRWLKLFSWAASIGTSKARGYVSPKVYAVTRRGGRKAKFTYMHRIIIDAPEDMQVDHINGNSLDNRKANLRLATKRQNIYNIKRTNKHGYRGVWRHACGLYYAAIKINGATKFTSRGFPTAEEAAREYDKIARERHGDFATLNFPE